MPNGLGPTMQSAAWMLAQSGAVAKGISSWPYSTILVVATILFMVILHWVVM